MTASDNSPNTGNLLTPRNLIAASLIVLVLSIIGMCWTMLQPNDSGGMGHDSYGTRQAGFRALYELLDESGVKVTRELSPPRFEAGQSGTIALLDPNAQLVGDSPKFVSQLLQWVEGGGRLVVALPPDVSDDPAAAAAAKMFGRPEELESPDLRHLLGIEERVEQSEVFLSDDSESENTRLQQMRSDPFGWSTPTDEIPPQTLKATATGSLTKLQSEVVSIAVPGDKLATLVGDAEKLDGSISVRDADGDDHMLVAATNRGAGQIIVISEPQLLTNVLLAKADNSVLALRLLAPKGQPVVVDEFYHGLAVRGNPLYLLTRPGFASVGFGLLVAVGVWTWRQAVFLGPPLVDPEPSRRDIREYIDAMGDFFCRGAGHRQFLAREVRDGVLHQLCHELKLPPDKADVDEITAILARRDPKRADALRTLFSEIDMTLRSGSEYPSKSFLFAMHRLSELSK